MGDLIREVSDRHWWTTEEFESLPDSVGTSEEQSDSLSRCKYRARSASVEFLLEWVFAFFSFRRRICFSPRRVETQERRRERERENEPIKVDGSDRNAQVRNSSEQFLSPFRVRQYQSERMSLSRDSSLPFRLEHLFADQASMKPFYPSSTSIDALTEMSFVDDFERYFNPNDPPSDSSHTSSPSLSLHGLTQFEFILNALTASSARINEETTTYLNQGQPYEIKFRVHRLASDYLLPTVYRSILRLCFWEKTLQTQERELMQKWLNEYQLGTLFDLDMNVTYGVLSIIRSRQIPNAVEIVWEASSTTSTTLSVRFKCTSTDFAHKRHGGEKGIPLRIQLDTYHESDLDDLRHLHSCCCKVQLFRLKGAQRKYKADQLRIEKLDHEQRRRYQTTLEHTALKACRISSLYSMKLLSLSYPPDDLSDVYTTSNMLLTDTKLLLDDLNGRKRNLSSSLPNIKYDCSTLDETPVVVVVAPPTKITVESSSADVVKWLEYYHFSSLIDRFAHYTGVDLLRLTLEDIRRICQGEESLSIRFYNQLNERVIPPLKTLYIRTNTEQRYSALYLHALTRRELEEKLGEYLRWTPGDQPWNLLVELNQIRIQIDHDNVIKYSLPHQARFHLKTFDFEIVLCLIND